MGHPMTSPRIRRNHPSRRKPLQPRTRRTSMILSPIEYKFILRRDFLSFAERAFHEVSPQTALSMSPHIELIAARLEACRLGLCRRLIINVPPRHLKSHLASIALPAWFLGHYPFRHVICACYGQDLSDKFARDTRTVMLSPWYQRLFPTRIAEWRGPAHHLFPTAHGAGPAVAVGSTPTGGRGGLFLPYDTHKPDQRARPAPRAARH